MAKKFSFSLQRLLSYKEQVFGVEQGVLAEMNARLTGLQQELADLELALRQGADEFNQQAAQGVSAMEIMQHKTYLGSLNESILQKKWEIKLQRQAIDRQTDKVREAKIEISTMEKLKEKKLEEYNYQENKAQELFIEEFISNKRVSAAE